jgi:hypothetical protein
MQGRLQKKASDYLKKFKEDVKTFSQTTEDRGQILQYMFDYEPLVFQKEDFEKRKREKNEIPVANRCIAKISNQDQCTRRRKKDCAFCGTHLEKRPYGEVELERPAVQQIQVWAQEIKGILYHLDNNGNVYKPEDVISNKMNPKIIAKYVKEGDVYRIPELGL